jgi:hypothetical protein
MTKKKPTKYKEKKYKKREGIEPNFTTPEPSKEGMDNWIKKHIDPKIKKGKDEKE